MVMTPARRSPAGVLESARGRAEFPRNKSWHIVPLNWSAAFMPLPHFFANQRRSGINAALHEGFMERRGRPEWLTTPAIFDSWFQVFLQ